MQALHSLHKITSKSITNLNVVQLFLTYGLLLLTRPLCPWDSPGKNIGVGSHALLQEGPRVEPESFMSPALTAGFFTTIAIILVSVSHTV